MTIEQETEPRLKLPESWCLALFDETVEVVSDEGKRVEQANYLPAGSVPVIDQGQQLIGGYSNDATQQYQGPIPVVLFGDHTRRIKYVDFRFAVGAQGVKILRPKSCWAPKFFAYLIPTLPLPDRGYSRHFQFLRKLALPLAPLPEQHRIVLEIERQLTRLDAAVAALRRVQANLKRYRASVLKAACDGRLVPIEAELARREGRSYETGAQLLARILKERRALWERQATRGRRRNYVDPQTPDTPELAGLPEGWAWASIDQLGIVQLGRQRSPKNRSKDHPVQYLRAANITEKGLDLSDLYDMEFSPEEQQRYRLRSGDLVLSEASGSADQVGKPAVWRDQLPNCCFQNTVIRLRPALDTSDYLLVCFMGYYTRRVFARVAGGVGINHLSADRFSRVVVPLPPVDEQRRIVAETQRRLSIVAELESGLAAGLRRAERLRQAILRRALEGKLVPQDPNDEPAGALLERIRAERASREKAKGKLTGAPRPRRGRRLGKPS